MSSEVPAEFLAQPDRYFLEWIPSRIDDAAHAKLGKKHAIAQFALTGDDGGHWYIELGDGAVVPRAGQHARPSFTLSMSVDTWRALNRQELNGLKAYMRGDIKISGSLRVLMRVGKLFSKKN